MTDLEIFVTALAAAYPVIVTAAYVIGYRRGILSGYTACNEFIATGRWPS